MNQERKVTLARRVDAGGLRVDGSKKRQCGECEEDVWITPATQAAIAEGTYPEEIVCLTCMTDE